MKVKRQGKKQSGRSLGSQAAELILYVGHRHRHQQWQLCCKTREVMWRRKGKRTASNGSIDLAMGRRRVLHGKRMASALQFDTPNDGEKKNHIMSKGPSIIIPYTPLDMPIHCLVAMVFVISFLFSFCSPRVAR